MGSFPTFAAMRMNNSVCLVYTIRVSDLAGKSVSPDT